MMWMRKSFSIRESRQKEADGDESEGSASREEEESVTEAKSAFQRSYRLLT